MSGANKLVLDTEAFVDLERSFTETLNKMSGDDTLEKFKFEYEKLYEAFKKSHKGEQRLITRVRELSEEIVENAKKVQTALKLSEDDQVTILDLKEEIKKAWNMVDAAHEKEVRAKESIKELRKEIDEMTVLIEKGTGLTADHEQQVEQLESKHSELLRKLDEKQKDLESHHEAIQGLHAKVNRKRTKAKVHKSTIAEQTEALREKEAEGRREGRRKERMNQELNETRIRLDETQTRVKELEAQAAEAELKRKKLEISVNEGKGQVDKFVRENKILLGKMSELSVQAEDLMARNETLQKDMLKQDNEIVARDRIIARQKEDLARATRLLDSEKKQTGRLQSKRSEEKGERDALVAQINMLSKDGMDVQREAELKGKKVTELQRNQDMQQKKVRACVVPAGVVPACVVPACVAGWNAVRLSCAAWLSCACRRGGVWLWHVVGGWAGGEGGGVVAEWRKLCRE
jgi:chromosome segregation ATPase